MIVLDRVTKFAESDTKTKAVLASVSLTIPSDRPIALLGASPREKRILIDVLAGVRQPERGRVVKKAQLSFPVGMFPAVEPNLSVRKNIAHLARLYGGEVERIVEFVRKVFDMGAYFEKPISELPAELKEPLAKIVAYSLPFDVYLLQDDDIKGKQLRDICWALFKARLAASGMIIPTQKAAFARSNCRMALVLFEGQLVLLNTVDEGLSLMDRISAAARHSATPD